MWLHCDCICLKTVEPVADFNQLWQSFKGYRTLASSVSIGYLNRVKRDTFNTLMREEGEKTEERSKREKETEKSPCLIRCQHICCQMQTLVCSLLALSLLLASGNPACTQQLKSSTWTLHPAKHSNNQQQRQHKDTWTYCPGVPCASLWCMDIHGLERNKCMENQEAGRKCIWLVWVGADYF